MDGIVEAVARHNVRETKYTPSTFIYIESDPDDDRDRADPGMRYTIQVTGDTGNSKQFPSAHYCNRQTGRLVGLYVDPREVLEGPGRTTTVSNGVTHLRFPPRAVAFVPDVPSGLDTKIPRVPPSSLQAAGLTRREGQAFPANAYPMGLGEVEFSFKAKQKGESIKIRRVSTTGYNK